MPRREKSLQPTAEIVLSTRETSYRVSRDVAAGRLKKIAPRLYTSRVKEAPDKVIRRNLWDVIGLLFPDAVISQRTALELQPAQDGTPQTTQLERKRHCVAPRKTRRRYY